jgi:hypothetical protein
VPENEDQTHRQQHEQAEHRRGRGQHPPHEQPGHREPHGGGMMPAGHAQALAGHDGYAVDGTIGQKAASVALVGLGVALIEVEWVPAVLLGAAAVAVPDLLPRLGRAVRPLVKGIVRAGYKAREIAAEASEQMQDIIAEVRAEQHPVEHEPPAPEQTS